ncbi:hypothetical protein [Roseateles chitosanitabidus]|uniref:hypothetical protein n=1 Tax=Roseateles chitosanitabidus TaxID=65048 RepID=UPI00082BF0A7|nr:hypothetical protein [Roseateles chitosanitabidus]MBO9688954.1 hypothetical protein [Roseateles chitosanitabidus]
MTRPSSPGFPLARRRGAWLALLGIVLLSACSSGRWLRDGTSPTETERDLFDCEREAARMYPPAVVTEQRYGGQSSEKTKCTKKGEVLDCSTTTTPAYSSTVDANEDRRLRAQGSCMRGRGYWWQEDR